MHHSSFIASAVVKFVFSNATTLLDKAAISTMIPKGLGAAVIATLPLRKEHHDGPIIQSICFSVILFSTIYCAGLFFLLKTRISLPFYSFIFGGRCGASTSIIEK